MHQCQCKLLKSPTELEQIIKTV